MAGEPGESLGNGHDVGRILGIRHDVRRRHVGARLTRGQPIFPGVAAAGPANVDLYGHLMPGGDYEALILIDAFYDRVTSGTTAIDSGAGDP
jgi:hypothetical protein